VKKEEAEEKGKRGKREKRASGGGQRVVFTAMPQCRANTAKDKRNRI
jgi:hypothetical protein